MKGEVIIFGCGVEGKRSFSKISNDFDIIAFSDNNSSLWGRKLFDVPIIPPSALLEYKGVSVVICVALGFIDIAKQLEMMGVACIVNRYGLFYKYIDTVLYPISFRKIEAYRKTPEDNFSVLFVQDTPCTRTDKISCSLKEIGVITHNAYFRNSSRMPEAYDVENAFYSYDDLLEFVNNSEFDIVHCSNEPDILTNLLLQSNKKIIYDAHDMITVRNNNIEPCFYYLEYAANKFSDGYMCTDDYSKDLQIKRYGFSPDRTIVIQNLPLENQLVTLEQRKSKLSASDGELHMVYEGGISDNPKSNRFFENLWSAITAAHIHIHYYSQQNIEYCKVLEKTSPYLHYEGNLSSLDLIIEMTQYDIGSILLNPIDKNADMAYPNKLYEYLAAGLPIVSNLTASVKFVELHNVGGNLDFNADIKTQLQKYAAIQIPNNYLLESKLTMNAYANDILKFYKKIACQGKVLKR